jgi:hypothetical protein
MSGFLSSDTAERAEPQRLALEAQHRAQLELRETLEIERAMVERKSQQPAPDDEPEGERERRLEALETQKAALDERPCNPDGT